MAGAVAGPDTQASFVRRKFCTVIAVHVKTGPRALICTTTMNVPAWRGLLEDHVMYLLYSHYLPQLQQYHLHCQQQPKQRHFIHQQQKQQQPNLLQLINQRQKRQQQQQQQQQKKKQNSRQLIQSQRYYFPFCLYCFTGVFLVGGWVAGILIWAG